jgi:hypothetical protein
MARGPAGCGVSFDGSVGVTRIICAAAARARRGSATARGSAAARAATAAGFAGIRRGRSIGCIAGSAVKIVAAGDPTCVGQRAAASVSTAILATLIAA